MPNKSAGIFLTILLFIVVLWGYRPVTVLAASCSGGNYACDCYDTGSGTCLGTPCSGNKACSDLSPSSCSASSSCAGGCVYTGGCSCSPGSSSCGGCSASCGGGTQSCTNGCSNWSQACNTQSCCTSGSWTNQGCGIGGCGLTAMRQTRSTSPSGCTSSSQCANMYPTCVANCSAMTASRTTIYNGESTDLSANYFAPANLQTEIFYGTAPTMNTLIHQNPGGTNASLSYTWTPTTSGNNITVGCRSFHDTLRECRPTAFVPSPAGNVYACAGPTTTVSINVLNPSCSLVNPVSGATNGGNIECLKGGAIVTTVRSGDVITCRGRFLTTPLPPSPAANMTQGDWNVTGNATANGSTVVVGPVSGNIYTLDVTAGPVTGPAFIRFSGTMANGATQNCSSNSLTINVVPALTSWFGGGGGGDMIASSGDIRSPVPVAIPPEIQSYFIDDSAIPNTVGAGLGYNSIGFDPVTTPRVNSLGWWKSISTPSWSNILAHPETSYAYMKERILARAPAAKVISGSSVDLSSGSLSIGAPILSGVFILRTNGPISISGDAGGLRYLILADGAVNITGNTGALSAANGFFAVLSGTDITVANSVGTAGNNDIRLAATSPQLRGVFYANNIFSTGGGNLQLKVEGTVVGMNGVSLGRSNAGLYPAEYFVFNPSFITTLSQVGLRHKIVQELLDF